MIVDPEQAAEERRRIAEATPATEPPSPPSTEQAATAAALAKLREGDDAARAHRWLARVRGDARPLTVLDLERAIANVAADEGVDVGTVRAGIDRMLTDAGGLAGWETRLREPRPRLGRGSLDAKDAPPPTTSGGPRQLLLVREKRREVIVLPGPGGTISDRSRIVDETIAAATSGACPADCTNLGTPDQRQETGK